MEKVRIGIVGSKFAATLHVQAYRKNPYAQVVAAASPGPRLPDFCKEHDISSFYSSGGYSYALEKADTTKRRSSRALRNLWKSRDIHLTTR